MMRGIDAMHRVNAVNQPAVKLEIFCLSGVLFID